MVARQEFARRAAINNARSNVDANGLIIPPPKVKGPSLLIDPGELAAEQDVGVVEVGQVPDSCPASFQQIRAMGRAAINVVSRQYNDDMGVVPTENDADVQNKLFRFLCGI